MSVAELKNLKKDELVQIIMNAEERKNNDILEELQSIKKLLQDQRDEIKQLHTEVAVQRDTLAEQGKTVRKLQIEVNILEQRNRKSNIIVTDVDLRSYSEAASDAVQLRPNEAAIPARPDAPPTTKKTEFITFLKKTLDYHVEDSEIRDVYQLRNSKVLVKFANTEVKLRVMAARKSRRTSRQHYMNDHLTMTGGELAKQCRDLRKAETIKYTWTKLGKIFVKRTDTSKTFEIQSTEDIEHFKHHG